MQVGGHEYTTRTTTEKILLRDLVAKAFRRGDMASLENCSRDLSRNVKPTEFVLYVETAKTTLARQGFFNHVTHNVARQRCYVDGVNTPTDCKQQTNG